MSGKIEYAEALDAFDIEGYLAEKGRVRRVNKTQVMVQPCPCCGDPRKDKFYINTSSNEKRGRWNSYCCMGGGDLSSMIAQAEQITRQEANFRIFRSAEGLDDRPIPLIATPGETAAPAGLVMPGELLPITPDTRICHRGAFVPLRERGISEYIMQRHQLCQTSRMPVVNGAVKTDYANRLFVPIFNHNGDGTLIGWQLRDLTGKASRKYLFPPEDKTSTTLYGLHEAVGGGTVLVVEGVFAKWAWDSLGRAMNSPLIENFTVASFGKKMSDIQIELLLSMPHLKKIIIGWDLDAAPQIVRLAEKIAGKRQLFIMEASPHGDHDELTLDQRKELLANARPYDYSLAAQLKARAALMAL